MSTMVRRSSRGAGLILLLFTLGCSIQAPQLEGLRRDLAVDPRDRLRSYDTCRARSQKPADLDECMRGEGYTFIPAGAQDYRASECWDTRYADGWPPAYCFEKAAP